MGGDASLPTSDGRTRRVVHLLRLTEAELARLWSAFRALDSKRQGHIDLAAFYRGLGEARSLFGDGLFELVGVRPAGTITFGEWLHVVTTYCLFGKEDVLKYALFVLDCDRRGCVGREDMGILADAFYCAAPPQRSGASARAAADRLDDLWYRAGGRIGLEEMKAFDKHFPALLFPAHRLQYKMILATMGEGWWRRRKQSLAGARVARELAEKDRAAKARAREERTRQRRIRRAMGRLRYYAFPFRRKEYDRLYPLGERTARPGEAEAQPSDRRQRERAPQNRLEEAGTKPPETAAWRRYLEQKERRKIELEGRGKQRPRRSAAERRDRRERRRDHSRRAIGPAPAAAHGR